MVNQLVQVPETYPSGAAHASEDGSIGDITDAPQGGKHIHIGDKQYYVDTDQTPIVKTGDRVEAGDVLSDGLPNPAAVVKHKGVGEGRRYFMEIMRDVLDTSGVKTSRRNIELLSRALINHVEINDESDSIPGALPGDVMEYDHLAHVYQPREDALEVPTQGSLGMYMEKPALHYSIGTRITPTVQAKLSAHKVSTVLAHSEPPPFQPHMVRAMTSLLNTPDWLTRLRSTYVQKGMLDSVHRGATADIGGKSYIPKVISGGGLDELQEDDE